MRIDDAVKPFPGADHTPGQQGLLADPGVGRAGLPRQRVAFSRS
jgi:hypothetical protein